MDGLQSINKKLAQRGKENKQYIHSPAHMLADELSKKLNDTKHFGLYLRLAVTHDHNVLRNIMGQVLESKNVKSPGKLFSFLVKKNLNTSNET